MHIPHYQLSTQILLITALTIFFLLALSKKACLWILKKYKLKNTAIIVNRIYSSLILIYLFSASFITLSSFNFSFISAAFLEKIFQIIMIFLIAFCLHKMIQAIDEIMQPKFIEINTNTNSLYTRKIHTHYKYITTFLYILLSILTIAAVLLSFDKVREIGVSMLASAGVAGAIILFASKSSFESFFAGIKLAFAQTIKLGDSLEIEGVTATVSEITLSNVILTTWEEKNLIIPINYFFTHTFINRTYKNTSQSGACTLYVDYTAPISEIRSVLKTFVQKHPAWDKKLFSFSVVEAQKEGMKCKIKLSANTADDLSTLQNECLEFIIAWLQSDKPEALPKQRLILDKLPFETLTVSN